MTSPCETGVHECHMPVVWLSRSKKQHGPPQNHARLDRRQEHLPSGTDEKARPARYSRRSGGTGSMNVSRRRLGGDRSRLVCGAWSPVGSHGDVTGRMCPARWRSEDRVSVVLAMSCLGDLRGWR